MRIYRIEDSRGLGPYHESSPMLRVWRWGAEGPFDIAGKHPSPDHDSGLRNWWLAHVTRAPDEETLDAIRFGFASLEQLHAWFYNDDWFTSMDKNGFHLRIYDVSDDNVIKGRAQVIFYKDAAKLVGAESLKGLILPEQKFIKAPRGGYTFVGNLD